MPRTALLTALVLPLFFVQFAPADAIDDYLKQEMEKRHIPALSLAIVQDGNVAMAKGYGLANVEL